MSNLLNIQTVKDKIITLRNKPVLLDSDVAAIYGVETMRINEAVKNNPEKFPTGYIFEISKEEKKEVIEIFDNPKIKFSPALPKAFTEQGLYMLATILKSEKATQTTIEIIETFAQIRELARTVSEIKKRKTPTVRIDNTLNKYDDKILFPNKLEKANEMLRKIGLPKQWITMDNNNQN